MKNRGVSWTDLQQMSLRQAEFVAMAGQVDEEAEADYAVNRQIALLEEVAEREGLSLFQLGLLGAAKVAQLAAAFSGTAIELHHVRPLLTEDEFTIP